MIKIVHIITGLTRGGAEKMLFKLLRAMDQKHFSNVVISLTDKNVVGRELEDAGFTVYELNMQRARFSFSAFSRLKSLICRERPDIVQTWLYHADLIGGLAARWAGHDKIAWNVRNSSMDFRGTNLHTILTMKACSLLSSLVPKKIIFCSENSRSNHVARGYCARKIEVIPNGINLELWRPNSQLRNELRASLRVPESAIIVGHPARFHPQKDHAGFIRSAILAHRKEPSLHFVLCGDQIAWKNSVLVEIIRASGKTNAFSLLGPRDDVHLLMNAFDVVCSSSAFGEAFPNVLLEGMACGVPCVTTDVGDAGHVVGDTGFVVPPREIPALAEALAKMAHIGPINRQSLGVQARKRATTCFDIAAIARRYQSLYNGLMGSESPVRAN